MRSSPRDIALSLARALDHDDYETARRFIAPTCEYELAGTLLRGPDVILASYRENSERIRTAMDEVVFESEFEGLDGATATIRFSDRIRKGTESYTYQCRQKYTIEGIHVVKIVNEELPGERDKANAFMARVGVVL